MENTKPGYGSMELYDVWSVDRKGEAERFAAHDKIGNRKLLWHGTNGETYKQPPLYFLSAESDFAGGHSWDSFGFDTPVP